MSKGNGTISMGIGWDSIEAKKPKKTHLLLARRNHHEPFRLSDSKHHRFHLELRATAIY